jgi:hypothetical protein
MLYITIFVFFDLLSDLNIFGSGSMEFVVPQSDSSAFFPISVRFMATDTFSDLKVRIDYFWHSNLFRAVYVVYFAMMCQNAMVKFETDIY